MGKKTERIATIVDWSKVKTVANLITVLTDSGLTIALPLGHALGKDVLKEIEDGLGDVEPLTNKK